jgi:hypothetical protein
MRHAGTNVMNSVASILIVYLSGIPINAQPSLYSILTTFAMPFLASAILPDGLNRMYAPSLLLSVNDAGSDWAIGLHNVQCAPSHLYRPGGVKRDGG